MSCHAVVRADMRARRGQLMTCSRTTWQLAGGGVGGNGTRRTGRPWGELKGDDPKLHEFARHLRGLVDRSGLSLQKVGERCRCSSTTVSKRLNGAELPRWQFVESLVEACVADPAVLEKRKGQLRALWQRASELPSRPREQRPATEVVSDPRSLVIAAQTAAIDAQRQLLDLHDRLHDAHQQLFDSQRAERSAAQMVWVLYWALSRAFELVGELTRKRDTVARLANGQGGLAPTQHQLDAAQDTRARTERQLERARSEHQRAVALAEAAGQKVEALQAMLSGSADPHDVQSPAVVGEDRMGIDDLTDLNDGLDRIERVLDAQDGELARLDHEINGPATAEEIDVARLLEIAGNSDISLTHRLKACDGLKRLGPDHHGDAAAAFRSMILDKSIGISDKAKAIREIGLLGGPYRQEASTIFQNLLDVEGLKDSNRISIYSWYGMIGDDEKRVASERLRRVALDDSVDDLNRVHAAAAWWEFVPAVATQVVTLLKEIRGREDSSEVVKE